MRAVVMRPLATNTVATCLSVVTVSYSASLCLHFSCLFQAIAVPQLPSLSSFSPIRTLLLFVLVQPVSFCCRLSLQVEILWVGHTAAVSTEAEDWGVDGL